ncbi:MAG: ABC transporter ATP-binding protein [Synergistaceae bacterium]|jgi:branched-chain amino acid transport system ATP-binding protein|nr:ABC transporter ATP-binding protein [Synergistaceae bacterium]
MNGTVDNTLEISGLDTSYGRIPMLRGVSLNVPSGQVCCVLGANGAGKTTLVKAILNMVKADRGSMKLEGKNMDSWPTHKRVKSGIAISAAAVGTFHKMTVEDNLKMGAYYIDDSLLQERLGEIYQSFPVLRERLRQKAGTLSGGERTMLAIARAVVNKPKLLILDEPSLGLAPIMIEEVFEIIRRLRATRQMSILLVEQNAVKALSVAGCGYVIQKGAIAFSGTADALGRSEFVENPVM